MAAMKPRVQIVSQSPLGQDPGCPATPSRNHGPSRSLGITKAQKQALIDNLQLEITERARKLRAQYALQAQGLRTRLEMRVNRIPLSLRNVTMGELLSKFDPQHGHHHDKDSAAARPAIKPTSTSATASTSVRPVEPFVESEVESNVLPRTRGAKRPSTEMDSAPDQENAPPEDLPNPKKRAKVAAATARPKNRATSRAKAQPSQVLSPKSSNSRTLPPSPVRPAGPAANHPVSPLKAATAAPAVVLATSSLAGMVEQAKVTRTTSGRTIKTSAKAAAAVAAATETGRRSRAVMPPPPAPAPAVKKGTTTTQRVASNTSTVSTATTGTVVVKGRGRPKSKATTMATVAAAAATTATTREKKVTTKKMENAVAAPAPRRTLRKRL